MLQKLPQKEQNLIGNKIADKITSQGKPKKKQKKYKTFTFRQKKINN